MIEVTEEEYEIIKKGIKLSNMKTEDLIYEVISRCHDKKAVDGDILSGTASVVGDIELPDGKEFRFRLENHSILKTFPFPSPADPLADHVKTLVMGDYPRGKKR